jgi:hypothetical protein
VSGHDSSRAICDAKLMWALAPEGRISYVEDFFRSRYRPGLPRDFVFCGDNCAEIPNGNPPAGQTFKTGPDLPARSPGYQERAFPG